VVVLGVKGKQVRIGIDAPKDVAVHREDRDAWVTGAPGEALKVIRQYPDTHMVATPVSTRVNAPKNNDAALIEPIAQPPSVLTLVEKFTTSWSHRSFQSVLAFPSTV